MNVCRIICFLLCHRRDIIRCSNFPFRLMHTHQRICVLQIESLRFSHSKFINFKLHRCFMQTLCQYICSKEKPNQFNGWIQATVCHCHSDCYLFFSVFVVYILYGIKTHSRCVALNGENIAKSIYHFVQFDGLILRCRKFNGVKYQSCFFVRRNIIHWSQSITYLILYRVEHWERKTFWDFFLLLLSSAKRIPTQIEYFASADEKVTKAIPSSKYQFTFDEKSALFGFLYMSSLEWDHSVWKRDQTPKPFRFRFTVIKRGFSFIGFFLMRKYMKNGIRSNLATALIINSVITGGICTKNIFSFLSHSSLSRENVVNIHCTKKGDNQEPKSRNYVINCSYRHKNKTSQTGL